MNAVHRRKAHPFRVLFARVADSLSKNEAFTLAYIYGVPSNRTEAKPMVLHVFEQLERQGILTPDDDGVTYLYKMMGDIGRADIQRELDKTVLGFPKDNSAQNTLDKYYKSTKKSTKKRPKKRGNGQTELPDFFNSTL